MGAGNDDRPTPDESETGGRVFNITARSLERRLPGIGLTRFRALGAMAEAELEVFYTDEPDARAFVNALVAEAIVEPSVTAAEVDAWSERARAIARVATAEVLDCRVAYDRLAGKGMTGDERLLQAMRERRAQLLEELRASFAGMRAQLASGMTMPQIAALPKMPHANVVDMALRRQRQMERLFRAGYFEQMEHLRKRAAWMMRSPHFARLETLPQARLNFSPPQFPQLGEVNKLVGLKSSFSGLTDKTISSLFAKNSLASVFAGYRASSLFASDAFSSATRRYMRIGDDAARSMRALQPRYFGALQLSRLSPQPGYLTAIHDLAETARQQLRAVHLIQTGGVGEHLRARLAVERLREGVAGFLERYRARLEQEWSKEKERDAPRPLLFVLVSLPAVIGLYLLGRLEQDDELLLARLEENLRDGLASELQEAVQRDATLDPVAKRHLVQALAWVAEGRFIDATPPLYDGLERAFRSVARQRGIIDERNRFLVPAHQNKATKVEDVFRHLKLDRYYERFLNAWVFGTVGNAARHCDLPEDEHRRCVLRAVLAVVGWLEYLGGNANAVGELVARLELERGDEEAEAS